MNKINFHIKVTPNINNQTKNVSFGSRRYSNQLNNDVFEPENTKKPERKTFFSGIINAVSSVFNRKSENLAQSEEISQIISETEEKEEIQKAENQSFVDSPDYDEKLKKATQGKYQQEIFEILSNKNLSEDIKKEINNSGLCEEEFFGAVKKLSASTFKAGLNNPTQYINYTQDPDYPSFLAESMFNGAEFSDNNERSSAYMTHFFGQHIVKLAKALQYVDTDTLNQMMDKRSTGFKIMLNGINKITPENGEILKELISQTKEGDANKKIKLCQLVGIFQTNGFDMNLLKNLSENEDINMQSLNKMFKNALLQKFEVDESGENINTNFNEEYIHLLFSESPMLNRAQTDYSSNFNNLMKAAINGNFKEYISDENNQYGIANAKTKQIYEQYGLNYESWLNPGAEIAKFDLNGKEMTLKMWDRNPQEDLFIGNKTRCCTAISTGSNSAAMPLFLLNTAFNVIELSDSKGNVTGSARIYMANVEDEPSLVIDSIELSDVKQMNQTDKTQVAENIYKYAEKYAQTITGRPTHVYYIAEDSRILTNTDISKTEFKPTEFIGEVSSDRIYSNSKHDAHWDDIRDKKIIDLYQAA